MSGDIPSAAKIISPLICNEKPWDLWVSEIGHLSPRRDAEPPAPAEGKGGAPARRHPYKDRRARRSGHNRLKLDTMSLHGLFPQMDNLNAAVCHMCGVIVKCSAAYRHLLESHTDTEPILPPPATPNVKGKVLSRSRHKKDNAVLPPLPVVDLLPVKMDTSPVHTATAPLSRIVSLPQQELYLDEASTSTAIPGEVQVCVESGELPVVSIQDTEDLPLGENITDDIFAIMNSEGIESADDITNAADWKNIIRDIGNMQEINFPQTTDSHTQDLYAPVDTATLSAYTIPDTDLTNLQFATNSSPMLSSVIDTNVLNVNTQALKPAASVPVTPGTPSTKSQSRSKTSKTKFNSREYDPNKHCGVVTADNPKPCTRSLTCKAHALSLRRTVEGRAKPFDTLLAEHRASRDAAHTPAPAPPPPVPLLVPSLDLAFAPDHQVNDIYASLLSVEDPNAVLPDTSSLTSLLSQPLPADLLLPDEAELTAAVGPLSAAALPSAPAVARAPEPEPPGPPTLLPQDVCWYATCPRPLALCTFNASHAGGAVTLGKRFATVRSNIKSSLSRSQKTTGANNFYYGQNALSLSKTVHMNASKTNKPEVRKLIVTCSGGGGAGGVGVGKEVQAALGELWGGEVRHALNGHVAGTRAGTGKGAGKRPGLPAPLPAVLDLGFALDPLLADEKC